MNKSTVVLVLTILMLVTLAPGIARAEGVELVYDLNFGAPEMHRSTWNRLEISVVNDNGDDLEGSVVIGAGGEYVREVFIEAGKTAAVVFYLPPMDVAENWVSSGSGIEISLLNSRGRELDSSRIITQNYSQQTAYAAVLGSSSKGFSRLANVLPSSQVVEIGPEHLDNLLFAQNFNAIIINDPETVALNSGQEENLRRWVAQGGVLILGGGSSWQRIANLVPQDLLPLQPRSIGTIQGIDLGGLQLPVPPEAMEYTVALGDLQGETLLAAGEVPLLVRKVSGQGAVLWSALDLQAAPLDNPANNEAYWEQVFNRQPTLSSVTSPQQTWAIDQVFNNLSRDSLASALSPFKILLLLLAYIILAGPVNWLVLRRLDRREWAWLTIPVLAILFTTGAFAAGRIGRGTERILYQVNLINVHSESLASARSYSGVFVPRRGKITLEAPVLGLAPLEGTVVLGAPGQTSLEFTNPPLWSVQRFFAADYLGLPGNFSVTAKLDSIQGGQLTAEVANNSGKEIFDSYIRVGNQWYPVGPLEAGERKSASISAEPRLDFNQVLGHYSVTQGWFEIEEFLPNSPMIFIGFGEEGIIPFGEAQPVALDIWIQAMDFSSIDLSQGTLDIPHGILTPTMMGDSGNPSMGGEYHVDGQGRFDLAFKLPDNIDYSQGEFYLNLQNFWGEAQGNVAVFNSGLGEWQELTSLSSLFKSQQSFLLENPRDLVQENRLIVRVEYEGFFGFSTKGLDITVKGGRIND